MLNFYDVCKHMSFELMAPSIVSSPMVDYIAAVKHEVEDNLPGEILRSVYGCTYWPDTMAGIHTQLVEEF